MQRVFFFESESTHWTDLDFVFVNNMVDSDFVVYPIIGTYDECRDQTGNWFE